MIAAVTENLARGREPPIGEQVRLFLDCIASGLAGRAPGVVLRRVLERHGLLAYFSAISYSDEVGVADLAELPRGR